MVLRVCQWLPELTALARWTVAATSLECSAAVRSVGENGSTSRATCSYSVVYSSVPVHSSFRQPPFVCRGADCAEPPELHSVIRSPFQQQQFRGYKSNKRSLKPLNTAASWKAAQPFLPPAPPEAEQLRLESAPIVDTCIPEVPVAPKPDLLRRLGVITDEYKVHLQRIFAVVEVGGTQFKVTPDDIIFVNQLPGVDVNEVLALGRVMLLGSRAQTVIGRPYVPGASVIVAVEEHFKDGKVHVFKKRRRKRFRKYQGPRPNLTTLRVVGIRGIEPAPGDEVETAALPVRWYGEAEGGLPLLDESSQHEEEEEGEEEDDVKRRVAA